MKKMDFSPIEETFNQFTNLIEPSMIRVFDQEVSDIDGIIRLTLGQPDFPTPQHIKDAAIRAIEDNFTGYTHSNGDIRVRQAASNFVNEKYRLNYNPQTEVVTTVGATEALTSSLYALINPGDKILIPSPFFSLYESIVKLVGGDPILMNTEPNHFILSPDQLQQTLDQHGDAVKAVILNYPTNPTGVTWTREECEALANVLQQYPDVFVISDEVYSEITYEESHVSLSEFLREQTILINGISKSHAMTGWRIGFIFAPEEIAKTISKVHGYFVTSTTSISQAAAIEALNNGKNDTKKMNQEYVKRRDLIFKRLTSLGFSIPKPKGAFYIFAKIPDYIHKGSYEFALDLAHKAKVATIPGVAFGPGGERYLRISYAQSLENIEEAMDRIEEYMNSLEK